MKFEQFDRIYTAIQKHHELQNKISDFIEENICTDSYCFCNMGDSLAQLLLEVLERAFNDKDKWIEYCLYEKPDNEDCAWEADGTPISLNTTREIYNFLISNMEDK